MIEFFTVNNNTPFFRMRIDVVVNNISFAEFMCKLKHLDKSWSI